VFGVIGVAIEVFGVIGVVIEEFGVIGVAIEVFGVIGVAIEVFATGVACEDFEPHHAEPFCFLIFFLFIFIKLYIENY
jgi:hypothetical protein